MLALGFDLETTGLDQAAGHRIIEVALVFRDLSTWVEKGRWVRRVNPERPIDPKAQAVHGITFDMVSACPTWDVIGPQVSLLMNKADLVIAHNGAGFDMPFVNGELARIGQPVCNKPVLDTMLEGRWATPLGKFPNLGELCFATGVPYDPASAHSASYDVDVMMQCVERARKKGFFQTILDRQEQAA